MIEKNPRLDTFLRSRQLRVTEPRQAVFETLRDARAPLKVGHIIKQLPYIDRVSIYRTLELFVRIGVATIVMRGWKRTYELKSPFAPHHHHLECTRCGKIIDINTPELETLIHTIAKSYGLQLTSHHIELAGVCNKCNKLV